MKRFELFFVLFSALLVACEPINPNGDQYPVVSADDYYWHEGEKIYLERGNQEYIIYDDALLSEMDKQKLEISESDSYLEEPNLKWGITKPNTVVEDLEHVLYRMPSYTSEGTNFFVTHSFLVKLKDSDDLPILQNMAEQYNVKIVKEEFLPLWYLLVCNLPSSSNALDIANRFYESGKFAVSEPNFIGGLVLHNSKKYRTFANP